MRKFSWIKRRARKLQRYYGISLGLAVHEAWVDWISLQGSANA